MRRTAALAAACILFGWLVTPAGAFELERVDDDPCGTKANLFWNPPSAVMYTGLLTPTKFQQLADTARSRWNLSVGSFHFDNGVGDFCNFEDGVVAMAFAATGCGGASLGDAVAITITRFKIDSGELLDANIVFDANEPLLDNDALFLEVAAHEMGHVLGLDHSDACGQSGAGTLMKTTISLGEPRLDGPQADDVAGVNFIYGSQNGGSPSLENSSCAIARQRAPRRNALPFLVLPLLLVVVRRRRNQVARSDLMRSRSFSVSGSSTTRSSSSSEPRSTTP